MFINKFKTLIIMLYFLLVSLVLDLTLLKNIYLFGWIASNWVLYLGLVLIVVFAFLLKFKILAYGLTISIILGQFIGQYLGDLILFINKKRITDEIDEYQRYLLSIHYGYAIWVTLILLAIFIGIGSQFIIYKRNKLLQTKKD